MYKLKLQLKENSKAIQEEKLAELVKSLQKEKSVLDIVKSPLFIISITIMLMMVALYFLAPGITGYFISEEGLMTYEQNISWEIDSNAEHQFVIEEHPEAFELRTLRLSGSYTGNGTVKAYLEDKDGNKYLIFDDKTIAKQELSGVTGFFVGGEEEMPEEAVPDYPVSDMPEETPQEEIPVEETTPPEIPEEAMPAPETPVPEQPVEQVPPVETPENVTEESPPENVTEEIPAENITEEIDATEPALTENITANITEEINATENITEVNITEANVTENITEINATEEVNITGNATEINVSAEINATEGTAEEINVTEEIEEANITEEVNITEEIIPLDKYKNVEIKDAEFRHEWKKSWGTITEVVLTIDNQENQSIAIKYLVLDIEGYEEPYIIEMPTAEVVESGEEKEVSIITHFSYADKTDRKVRVRIKDETTLIIASKTFTFDPKEAEEIKEIKFSLACAETCLLPPGLNGTDYNIVFEVDSGLLKIDKIDYALKNLTVEANETNVTYEKIKEDLRYDAIIDSTEYDNETDELIVIFHHDSAEPLPIIIKGKELDYELSQNTSSAGEDVTLIVHDWQNKRFRILVGEHTEAFEFGVAGEISLGSEVIDSQGNEVNATIELIDSLTKETKGKKEKGESSKNIEEGEYNLKIKPENHPIQSIEFKDMEIYEDFAEPVNIDDVNETGELSGYIEVYAIDPTNLDFTNATVTVTAKGTELYKCKDWNFTEQICYGNWTKLMDIVPGQNYTFELTPEDPGFAEIINITKAEHLDENKAFISEIYEQVKELDDIWSETIPSGHYVRVTFEQNLTSVNDITLYPRTVSGTPRIEAYEKDGIELVAEFTNLNDSNYNKIYLTNLSGSQDTFDLLILGGDVEFDHIIDPFPEVISITSTIFSSAATTHNVNMPATVEAGDLLLALFTNDGSATVTTPSEWTSISTLAQVTYARGSVFAKIAVGNEDGTTVNFATSASEQAAAHVYLIPANKWYGNITTGVEAASGGGVTTSSTVNPPSLNPASWDVEDTLWIAYAAGSSWTSVSTWPTNYENSLHNLSNTGTDGASVSSARRELAAASDDPAAFSMSSTGSGVAFTIAIRPKANDPPTTPTSIKCDGGNCNNTFSGDVDINCSGSTDPENNPITYSIDAYYQNTTIKNTTTQVPSSCSDGTYASGAHEFYSIWTIPGSGTATVTKLWFWQADTSLSNSETLEIALYNSSGSQITEEVTLTGTGASGWISGTLITPVNITLGNTYYVGVAPVSATYNLGKDTDANCADYPPGTGSAYYSYYVNPSDNDLDSTVPTGTKSTTSKYMIPGISYTYTDPAAWSTIGNHTAGSSYIWNISGITPQSNVDIKCRAIDNGSNTYSGYYEPSINLTISSAPPDTIPPAAVTNLANISRGTTSIYWNWTNPVDADFNAAIIYLDNANVANTSSNYYNATGLSSGNHTIRLNTKDTSGNINATNVSSTASTLINNPPTHTTPVLNATSINNLTTDNLTCYNQSTYDAEGDSVKNIYNWYRNGTSIMVLNMPFEGGSNSTFTRGYSIYGNNGTVTNATWNQTGGYDGKGAYEFDGISSYIDTLSDAGLNLTSEITVVAWVKLNQLGKDQKIVGRQDGTSGGYKMGVYTNNKVEFEIRNSSNSPFLNRDVTGGTTLTAGVWYHVAGVYSASRGYIRTYVNGNLDRELNTTGILAPTTGTLDIGKEPFAAGFIWNGTIDDIKIFRRSLSAEQINALYKNRTDLIVSNEILEGETWMCSIIPNDRYQDGARLQSNNLVVRALDITPPASVTNLANASRGTTWIYWNWTNPADADFNSSIIYINGTNVANVSKPTNYYNATGLNCQNNYIIKINTKDTTGNINTTNVNNTAATAACPDINAPTYSAVNEPADPSSYSPSANFNFNITWTDSGSVDEVILEFDGTNYSYKSAGLTKSGDIYIKTFASLAVGTYNYRWYANDTSNNWNNTNQFTFNVSKAASVVNLLLNGNNTNITVEKGSTVNETGVLATGAGIIELYEGNIRVNIGTSPLWNLTTYNILGTFNVSVYYFGNENYTATSELHYITVQDASAPASVTNLANKSAGYTWIYWNWTNPADSDFNHTEVWINGTFYSNVSKPTNYYNATGLINNTWYQIQTRTADNFNNVNSTWVNSSAKTLADTIAPTWTTIPANATLEYGVDALNVDFDASDNIGLSTYFINYTTNFSINSTGGLVNTTKLVISTYYINVSVNDTSSNVNSTVYKLTVQDTKAPASVTNLANKSAGYTWIYWNWTNPADSDFNHTEVWINGTFYSNVSKPTNYYNATGLINNTWYQIQTRTADNFNNVNSTWVNNTAKTIYDCPENWTAQYTACNISDKRIKYYTDQSSCGTNEGLPIDNGTVESCNYCSYSVVNTSWSGWQNQDSCLINDSQLQNRSLTEYDSNYESCYAVTGLPSDLWNLGNNNTYWDYQYVACDYCSYNITNTTWTEWSNQGSCLTNDSQLQNRSKIEYDTNYVSCYAVTGLPSDLWNSGNNNTHWDYQYVACDYCIPNWYEINTSCQQNDTITGWYNDSNNCYAQTGLASDNNPPASNSYPCDYCTPNLVNTTWTSWIDVSACYANDTKQQSRNLTQYDSNYCGEVANETFFEYQFVACDYCNYNVVNTSWSGWQNQDSCLINDSQLQNRSLTEYDSNYESCYAVTGLPSDLWNLGNNNTYWDYQYVACDYCSYNITNTTWTEWSNQGSCLTNDSQLQNRSKIEYDSNYSTCYTVTGLPSDLWNSGNNNTYWDYQYLGCNYCTEEIQGPFNNTCNSTDRLTRYYVDSNYSTCCIVTGLTSDCHIDNGSYANATLWCDYDGLPFISIVSPQNIAYDHTSIQVEITTTGASSTWFYNGTANETYTSPVYRTFAEGEHTVSAWANDTYGNVNTTSVTFKVDLTPPNITLVRPVQDQIVGYTVTLDADVTDNLVNVDSVWYEITNASGTVKTGTLTSPNYQDTWDTTAVSDGNYTFIVYANDSVGNDDNKSATFTVDNTQPFIQILNPTNNSRWTENFNLNITYQNTWLNITKYNITNSSGVVVQSNSHNSVQSTTDSFTDQVNVISLHDGTYTITTYALDSVGYTKIETGNFIVDNSAPVYSNVVEPTDPSIYSPTATYTFNITFTDDSIDDVWLVFNGVTYTDLTKDGNVYSKTLPALKAGTYEYTWYSNDTVNNNANTGTLTFTVNKQSTTLTLTASPTWTETYATQTTINCSADNPEVMPHLYRNGTEVSIPDIHTFGAGSYGYVCNATATENYSAPAMQQNTLTINKASTATNLYLNGAENNLTLTYPQQINATATTTNASVTLYRNGQAVSNPEIEILAGGTYNYTAINSGNENYTGSSATFFLNVDKADSIVNLLLNGNDDNLSIIHDRTVNITAYRVTGEGIVELYEIGNLIDSGIILENITSYHILGLKNITIRYPETDNYTTNYETHFITVTNELPTLDSLSISPTRGKLNVVTNVSTNNANDIDNDNYTLRCGDASGLSNLCNSTAGVGEKSCTFNSQWNDNSGHTVYCRLDDTVNNSAEKTIIFTADNTAPDSSLTAVDGDTALPYWDTSNNVQTILSAATETGAQCRWGTSDVVYSSMGNECTVSDGNINCNLGNVAQVNSTTYYISCKDQYGNEQSTSQNLDVIFGVDYSEPTTYDDYDGDIKFVGHQVTIYEEDIPAGTVITTWYCAPTAGCTPETLIDDAENVTFNNRGTNYLRYYSQDEAGNIQDTKTTQVFINNLINIGSLSYADYLGHSFDVSISPTDADSSQNTTCTLYHRLNGAGGYSSKAMTGTTTKTATISEADSYIPLDIVELYIECADGMETVNTTPETHQLENSIPVIPTLSSPENNLVTTETSMLLSYSSTDSDNDTITYYVYGDANANPTTLIYSGTSTSYNWTLAKNANGIQNNYWKVLASDSYQNSSFSETRDIIVNDTKAVSLTYPADQNTDRGANVTYTITITNNGAVADDFTITLENINSASIAVLNQTSASLAVGESKDITLTVADDDTVGEYFVNITAMSDNDPAVSAELNIKTTVYGTLSTYLILPYDIPPPIYYEGQDITFQGYVYDEFSSLIEGATLTFEPLYNAYSYICTNSTGIGSGYYNCTMNTAGMLKPYYYNVRANASKTYYHAGTFTNNSVFLLADGQRANLTLYKLPTVQSIDGSTIVYNISNIVTNARGNSLSTNLTDNDANHTWELGNLGTQAASRSYTLTFTRGDNSYLVTLNKSNANGYDPIYENMLFAESNQPTIVIPENETLNQLTLVKNLVYKNQTVTNITYEIVIEVVNSGDLDYENIEVTDSDTGLDTKINLTEGKSWQTSSEIIIQKNPQTYTKSFAKTRASASGNLFYSNQLNITIPGYGGPYDVIITDLPSSVETGKTITAHIKVINQNTEVAEDRWLTTVIKDASGNVYDIDIRTVYIGRNQSAETSITLNVPSAPGNYYVFSELVWPTATANATKGFSAVAPEEEEEVSGAGGAGGAGGAITSAVCGDGLCAVTEMQNKIKECLIDCGYDCDGDNVGDSWLKCIITIQQIPEDLKEDIITLRNKINQLENKISDLKESGAATQEAEELLGELKGIVREAEEKTSQGKFDWARNLIRTAYVKATTIISVEGPSGAAVKIVEKMKIPWKLIISFILTIIVIASIAMGMYYRYESIVLSRLKARRHRIERINAMIDKTIDAIYTKKRR